jgi:hypothetical protein
MAGVALALAGAALQRAPRPVSVESPSVVLREEAARLRELRTIDREAQVLLRRQIADLTAQNGDLRRRLALLRGVLVADAHTADLGVADVQLAPSGERGQVAYRLLLARTPPATGKMGGRVELWGVGEQEGRPREVRLVRTALALPRLQNLSGRLTLPDGFRPAQLRIVLVPRGRTPLMFEYAWAGLIAGEAPMPAATSLP